MSTQAFRDYVTNSGVNFDGLSEDKRGEWRERFDKFLTASQAPAVVTPVDLKKAVSDLRENMVEIFTTIVGKKRSLEYFTKTNPAYKEEVLDTIRANPAKFIPNWNGKETGNKFLSSTQRRHLGTLKTEAAVVANIYHILSEKLLPQFPAGYDLINSEEYAWIPPSIEREYDNIKRWYAPDLFIAPKYMVNYQGPYENAVTKSGNMNISYGRLETIRHYPFIFLVNAKLDPISNDNIGDFFHFFARPTSWYSCAMKGLLFSPTTFILVEFFNGFITYYCQGKWKTKGSEKLVMNFCVPVNTTMNDCLHHALSVYNNKNPLQPSSTISPNETEEEEGKKSPAFNFKIVQYSSMKDPFTTTGNFGSATLGAGGYGSVFKVIEEYSNTMLALKIVLDTSSRRVCSVDKEFAVAQLIQESNPDLVIGVVPGSLLLRRCVKTITYHAYLMSTVGLPFPPSAKIGKGLASDDAVSIFQLLFQLHVAGHIHGDARYVNCVKVISGSNMKTYYYRWIDFVTCDVFCSSLVKSDVSTFLESIGCMNPTEEQLDCYFQYVNQARAAKRINRPIESEVAMQRSMFFFDTTKNLT